MLTWLTHHKVIATGLAGLGVYVVYRHGKNAGAAQAQSTATDTSYQGPSYIGAPGPAVVMPGQTTDNSASTATATTPPFDIATFIQGQIELGRQNTGVANNATAMTTNTDTIANMLDRLNPKKYMGTQFNVGYDPSSGAVTHLDITKALDPLTQLQQTTQGAKISGVQRKDALTAMKQGFALPANMALNGAGTVKQQLSDWLAQVAAYKKSGGAIGQPPATLPTLSAQIVPAPKGANGAIAA